MVFSYKIIFSSIISLLVLNIVIINFMSNSKNFLFSKTLVYLGSLIYIVGLCISNKIVFIAGQTTILIGISFGIYGLYRYMVSNLPVILFSITFIISEIIAHIFNIRIIMFSHRLSGFDFSAIVSLVIPLIIGFISNYIITKNNFKK